VHKEL